MQFVEDHGKMALMSFKSRLCPTVNILLFFQIVYQNNSKKSRQENSFFAGKCNLDRHFKEIY